MTFEGIRSFMAGKLQSFRHDEDGVSALEFAMVLPLMLTLYLGGVEVSQAVSADRQNTLVAFTVGDLVAEVSNVASSDITNVFNAATAVAYPFPSSNLRTTVSSVCINSTGTIATIAWSQTMNGTARSGTVTSSIPSALMVPSSSLIWAESSYAYRPAIGWTITGTLTMSDRIFLSPRLSSSVTLNSGAACP
jgi:Flp pilus assembly protein TadG